MYFGKRKDWKGQTISQGFIQCITLLIAIDHDLVSYYTVWLLSTMSFHICDKSMKLGGNITDPKSNNS